MMMMMMMMMMIIIIIIVIKYVCVCVCGGGGGGGGVLFCSGGGKIEIYKGPLQTQTIHYLTLIQSG